MLNPSVSIQKISSRCREILQRQKSFESRSNSSKCSNNSVFHSESNSSYGLNGNIDKRTVEDKENLKLQNNSYYDFERKQTMKRIPKPRNIPRQSVQKSKYSQEDKKLQELNFRFDKIKRNYKQNHQNISKNLQKTLSLVNSKKYEKQEDQNIPQFQISMTLNEERDSFSNVYLVEEQGEQIEILSKKDQIFYENESQKSQTKKLKNQKEQQGLLERNNLTKKYSTLATQLERMQKDQLIELILEQIENHQNSKNTIEQLSGKYEKKNSQNQELKNILSKKRQEIEVLLQTENKNLNLIAKLRQKCNSPNHEGVQKTTKTMADHTFSCDSQYQADQERFNFNVSNLNRTKQQQEHYRQKYFQLQNYMNEYIANIRQAHEEYKHNLNEMRNKVQRLEADKMGLTNQNQSLIGQNDELRDQLQNNKKNLKQLETTMSNGKRFIKELEEDFCQLRQQNQNNLVIIQQLRNQKDQLKQILEQVQLQAESWRLRNEQETQKNTRLSQYIANIEQKVSSNDQISFEIKQMYELLKKENHQLQVQISQVTEKNQKLSLQLYHYGQHNKQLKKKQQQAHHHLQSMKEKLLNKQKTQNQLQARVNELQITCQQLQSIHKNLMQQYEDEKVMKEKLKQELVNIMEKVQFMEEIYGGEIKKNQLIKKQLENFWNNQLLAGNSKDKKASSDSFKQNLGSVMTKQGSSSVFKQINFKESQSEHLFSQDSLETKQNKSQNQRKKTQNTINSYQTSELREQIKMLRSSAKLNRENILFQNRQTKPVKRKELKNRINEKQNIYA